MHSTHYIQIIAIQYDLHHTQIFTIQYTLLIIQCTHYTLHYIQILTKHYSLQCTYYTLHYIQILTIHYILLTTVYMLYATLYSNTHYTLHTTVYTLHYIHILTIHYTLLTTVYTTVFFVFFLRPCQHDTGYMAGRSQIKVHTDKRTQVHSTRSSLTVTHPSTNRGQRCLTSVNVPLS